MTDTNLEKRIKHIRTTRVISPVRFGLKIGVKGQIVYDWENGEAIPETSDLLKIAEEFNVSINWLQYGIGSAMDKINCKSAS